MYLSDLYLTNNGNILREGPQYGQYYFQKPDGTFIREVSINEAEYLELVCLPIKVGVDHLSVHPQFLPKWYFIKSVCVCEDMSNFKPETSSNGGNYSFHTYHDWFVAKYPNGEWKFAFIERYSTSAEFPYDELAGAFQADLGWICISNSEDKSYNSQRGIEWIDGEKFYHSEEVLEKVGHMSDFFELWRELYEYLPSQWEEEGTAFAHNALSFTDKKEIITRLKELGVTRTKQRRGRESNARR